MTKQPGLEHGLANIVSILCSQRECWARSSLQAPPGTQLQELQPVQLGPRVLLDVVHLLCAFANIWKFSDLALSQ